MAVIGFSVGLILYWRGKGTFTRAAILYSLLAYAGAIALKAVLQALTGASVSNQFGTTSVANGLYLGMQTSIFEVGGAYVVARFAARRGSLTWKDGEAFGIGLAFWENGVLLGVFTMLLSFTAIYFTLASNLPAASLLYSTLTTSEPSLFYPPGQALPLMGLAILERVSSALIHVAWGYLCVLAATLGKRRLLILALPMGLVDALVVFAPSLTLPVLEAVIFGISLGLFMLTILATRRTRREMAMSSPAREPAPPQAASAEPVNP